MCTHTHTGMVSYMQMFTEVGLKMLINTHTKKKQVSSVHTEDKH